MLTVQLVQRGRNGFDACLTAERNSECSLEWRNHDVRMYAGKCGNVVFDMGLSTGKGIFAIGMVGCLVMRRVRAASHGHRMRCEHLRRRAEVCESRRLRVDQGTQPFHWLAYTSRTFCTTHRNTTARQQHTQATTHTGAPPLSTPCALEGNHHRRHVSIRWQGTFSSSTHIAHDNNL